MADPNTGEIIVGRNDTIDEKTATIILEAKVSGALVRSPMSCEAERGICQKCYGISLATWRLAMMGEAVGIIAAQSIGEPGTQLTMRTFHTGGIAGVDITSGLPRVEELFEARSPKGEAVLSDIDGVVEISDSGEGRTIQVSSSEDYSDEYILPDGYKRLVKNGESILAGTPIAGPKKSLKVDANALQPTDILARVTGKVQ